MKDDKILKAHDKVFNRVFTVKKNTVSLLRNMLPENIQKHLLFNEMTIEKGSFVSKNLRDFHSDLLVKIPAINTGSDTMVYFLFGN